MSRSATTRRSYQTQGSDASQVPDSPKRQARLLALRFLLIKRRADLKMSDLEFVDRLQAVFAVERSELNRYLNTGQMPDEARERFKQHVVSYWQGLPSQVEQVEKITWPEIMEQLGMQGLTQHLGFC